MSGRQNLSVLPERTGGRIVVGRNNPEEMVPQILDESSAYYLIGIERGPSARPDGMRRLEIKVRRKGAHVAAQRLYAGLAARPLNAAEVPAATKAGPLENALTGLMPRDEVPLSLAVTPFANPETGTPVVRVNVDVGAFVRSDGAPVPLDIAILAVDSAGRQVASARQTSTVTARRPESGPPFTLDVQSLLPLPPGEFGIRVAVSDPGAGRVGSVFSDVSVPDYADAPLALSGVSVESGGTANSDPVATTRRRFKRTEQVRAVLQMYQGTAQTSRLPSVSMRVRILDARGAAVHDQSLDLPRCDVHQAAGWVRVRPSAAEAHAGEYLARFDASAEGKRAGGHCDSVWSEDAAPVGRSSS